jgi:peptidoglycan hydrolase CwlO-like protein
MTSENQNKMIELIFKILSVLVIPFGAYIISMSTDIKLLEQKLQSQEEKVSQIILKVEKLDKDVAEGWSNIKLNTQEVRQMKEMITNQSQMVREVYEYVLRQQGGRRQGRGN